MDTDISLRDGAATVRSWGTIEVRNNPEKAASIISTLADIIVESADEIDRLEADIAYLLTEDTETGPNSTIWKVKKMQEYVVKIDQLSMAEGSQEGTFSKNIIALMAKHKFTMTGGFYVFLVIEAEDGFALPGIALLARRKEPVERVPETSLESALPEFMEYRAFSGNDGTMAWAVSFVNSLISVNGGKLPEGWLARAMNDMANPVENCN